MKNPTRTLPIVIVLSMTIVTFIYLLANVAYLAVLSPFEILSSEKSSAAIAVTFASRCMGVIAWVMPLFVSASVFGSINSEVLSLSRLCFTASERGHMPIILSMVSVNNLTPIPSVLAMILLSILFQLHEDVFILIQLTGLAFTVVSAIAVCSLLYIRWTNPALNKSRFKLPIFLPILYLVGIVSIGIFSAYHSPKNALLSMGPNGFGYTGLHHWCCMEEKTSIYRVRNVPNHRVVAESTQRGPTRGASRLRRSAVAPNFARACQRLIILSVIVCRIGFGTCFPKFIMLYILSVFHCKCNSHSPRRLFFPQHYSYLSTIGGSLPQVVYTAKRVRFVYAY
ncbi:hypothetical protein AHF37_04698 [Paragonimus kellicotti]|nr:hypothetical protein AHF37_04698 [Paragonimus kellicotti]